MARTDPRITIRADDKTKRAFRSAQNNMKKLASAATAVAAAVGVAGGAIVALMKRTVEATKQTTAFADALGVTVENLSRWQFAAQSVGLEASKVGDIMKDTAEKIGDAFRNNAGEAREAIESLGLSMVDLVVQSPDQQLLMIAEALDTVGTRAEKVQILESLGNDLSLLLPLLEDNAAGLRDLANEADDLGATLTRAEAEGIKAAQEGFDNLKGSFDALAQAITTALGGPFRDITRWFGKVIVSAIQTAEVWLDSFMVSWRTVGWVIDQVKSLTIPSLEEIGDKFESEVERMKQLRAAAQMEANAALGSIDAPGESAEAREEADRIRKEQRAKEFAELWEFEDAKTRLVKAGIRERTKWEQMTAKERTKSVIGDAIALTRGVTGESKKLFKINQMAAIANAIMNAHQAATKSLAFYPWPLGEAMAALAYASGMASVQAIRSASFGGGGGGAGPSGGGGSPVPTPPSDFATAPNLNQPQEVNITIEGTGMLARGQAETIAESLRELLNDGFAVQTI